jgi:O-antigen/teichoic acid export membrane protein
MADTANVPHSDDSASEQVHTEATRHEVTGRVVRGAFALGIRQVLVHASNVGGSILLARLLSPREYGIYAVITFFIVFLGTFGGTGLAANLIREHPAPAPQVYRAVYTLQQVAVLFFAVVFWALAPLLAHAYHLQSSGPWLFRLTALSLVATSAMVPPQIQMERALNFQRLAYVETAQALCFNITAVVLAWRGFGGISFGIALLVRSLIGVAFAYLLQPVSLRWHFDWKLAAPHLRYGLYYQSAQILSIVKDSITPLVIGYLVGSAGVGYLSWAGMIAAYPVLLLTVLQRLYLPAFGRLQSDPEHYRRFLEQILWATNALAAPFAVLLLVLIHPVTVLVFGSKWLVALPLFYLFWTANLFVPTSTPVQSVLNASGKASWAALFAAMWMVLTWGLGWPLALWKGMLGIAIANACVQVSNLIVFRVTQRLIPFRIIKVVWKPWALAISLGLLLATLQSIEPARTIPRLASYSIAAAMLYSTILVLTNQQRIKRLRTYMG